MYSFFTFEDQTRLHYGPGANKEVIVYICLVTGILLSPDHREFSIPTISLLEIQAKYIISLVQIVIDRSEKVLQGKRPVLLLNSFLTPVLGQW